jgi:thiamine monophosphate synthase
MERAGLALGQHTRAVLAGVRARWPQWAAANVRLPWFAIGGINLRNLDDVMAAGDNFNDVEMLDFAGIAILMGNAAPALRSRGYRVTGSNDEGGLATAIAAAIARAVR